QWYNLGTLEPGETRSVGELFTGGPKAPRSDWHKTENMRPKEPAPLAANQRRPRVRQLDFDGFETSYNLIPPYLLMKQALFYAESDRTTHVNSGLHSLDQSWRLWKEKPGQNQPSRDEVILVARAGPTRGNAEELTAQGITPT